MCWDVVVSEMKTGHEVEFLHLKKKISESKTRPIP